MTPLECDRADLMARSMEPPPNAVRTMECHRGRLIPQAVVREMLEAFGIKVCRDCHRFAGMTGRARVHWREPELVAVRRRNLPN
jgi:hypothetical protein